MGEMWRRCRGDVGEMWGRCGGDLGEMHVHFQRAPLATVRVRVRVGVRGRARARGRARGRVSKGDIPWPPTPRGGRSTSGGSARRRART